MNAALSESESGDRKNPPNYRLISLLTSFSKIFEKIICTRLKKHIYGDNILVNEQFGIRSQSSTTDASYSLINEILEAWCKKKSIGGKFCDLKKCLVASITIFYCLN
jgi:hypothetical protein